LTSALVSSFNGKKSRPRKSEGKGFKRKKGQREIEIGSIIIGGFGRERGDSQ